MSSLRQPSGRWPVSSPSIQEAMASPAWSIFARPPRLFAAPSPRSYASSLLNRFCSPIRRRWAECWEFSIKCTRRRERPPLWQHQTRTRESRASRRSPRVFLSAPPTTKAKAYDAPLRGAFYSSTRDGRERESSSLLHACNGTTCIFNKFTILLHTEVLNYWTCSPWSIPQSYITIIQLQLIYIIHIYNNEGKVEKFILSDNKRRSI